MTKEHDLEPIREWLDVKEHRRGYLGSTGKDGIGDYYCIPVSVLKDCGMSIDEIFYGKTYVEEQEWRSKHTCIKCGEMASSLDHDEFCSTCAGIKRAREQED